MSRSSSLAVLAVLACSLAVPARAAGGPLPSEPGTWWDITLEMAVRAPNAPLQTQVQTDRECLPKRIPDRAPPQSGQCTTSGFKRSGSRITFSLRCPDGVTGEVDLLWTADTYSGTTVMRGQGMENRIKMKGKKVGGDCDANEKELAGRDGAGEDDPGAANLKRLCADAAEGGELERFVPADPGTPAECKDAVRYCATLETRRGIVRLRDSGLEEARQQAGRLCKKDVAAIEKRLCAALDKEQGKKLVADDETSDFLFGSCPDLAKTLAKRECAGRSYTGMPFAKREFCTRWAQEALQAR